MYSFRYQCALLACTLLHKMLSVRVNGRHADKRRQKWHNIGNSANHFHLQVRAENLIAGLRGERARWEAGAAELEAALAAVPGDAALASAFLVYAGPFPADVRSALADGVWKSQACKLPKGFVYT